MFVVCSAVSCVARVVCGCSLLFVACRQLFNFLSLGSAAAVLLCFVSYGCVQPIFLFFVRHWSVCVCLHRRSSAVLFAGCWRRAGFVSVGVQSKERQS